MTQINAPSGWFSAFGDSGDSIELIFTVVFSLLAGLILLLAIFYGVKAGIALMSAESAEGRAEAKKKLMWIIIGAAIGLLAVLLPTILWSTIGKFSAAKSTLADKSIIASMKSIFI